ncbi:Tn3 family transposase [Clostridium sp. UBA7503]|uniref:Tn3 family transposase n=1 Tax=Clostridium sp. UBA7503 TaxID=1946377 RepID=UPI0032177633
MVSIYHHQFGVSSLYADYNAHYGTGKSASIYRHGSGQFSTFYTKVINTNATNALIAFRNPPYHVFSFLCFYVLIPLKH